MSALIAQLVGIGIITAAILAGGSVMLFINVPSILIVVGGTLAATLIRFSPGEFIAAISTSVRAIFPPKEITDLPTLIDLTEELLKITRRQGILAAENMEIDNHFYRESLQMLIDGYPEESMKKFLEEERHIFREKAETAAGVFRAMGDAAPAFGRPVAPRLLLRLQAALAAHRAGPGHRARARRARRALRPGHDHRALPAVRPHRPAGAGRARPPGAHRGGGLRRRGPGQRAPVPEPWRALGALA